MCVLGKSFCDFLPYFVPLLWFVSIYGRPKKFYMATVISVVANKAIFIVLLCICGQHSDKGPIHRAGKQSQLTDAEDK